MKMGEAGLKEVGLSGAEGERASLGSFCIGKNGSDRGKEGSRDWTRTHVIHLSLRK